MDSNGSSDTGQAGSDGQDTAAESFEREGDVYRYQVAASESLSDGLIAAIDRCVAATDDRSSLSDRGLLYDVVDLDALDRLFTPRSGPTGDVVFEYEEFRVRVTSSREIVIRRRETATDDDAA